MKIKNLQYKISVTLRRGRLVCNTTFVIFNAKFVILNTKFIIYHAKSHLAAARGRGG